MGLQWKPEALMLAGLWLDWTSQAQCRLVEHRTRADISQKIPHKSARTVRDATYAWCWLVWPWWKCWWWRKQNLNHVCLCSSHVYLQNRIVRDWINIWWSCLISKHRISIIKWKSTNLELKWYLMEWVLCKRLRESLFSGWCYVVFIAWCKSTCSCNDIHKNQVTSDASSTRRGLNKNWYLVVSTIVTLFTLVLKNNDCRENLRNVIKDNKRKKTILKGDKKYLKIRGF